MFASQGREMKLAGTILHQAKGGEEGHHHIGGPRSQLMLAAKLSQRRWMLLKPRKEIEKDQGSPHEIRGVKPIAQAIELGGIRGRERG
jgi:hypothetical protein